MSGKYFKDLGHLYENKIVGAEQKLEQDTSALKGTGPAEADGVMPIEVDPKNKKRKDSTYDEESFSNNVEQNDENTVKKERAEINNFTMRQKKSNKSSFDKLFEDVMGGDDPMDMGGLDMAPGGDEGFGDEDQGDEGDMDYVTLELDRDVAEKLHDLLGGVLGGDEGVEDIEDIEDLGDEGIGDEELPESHVDLENGPGDAVSKLAGHNNKVGGDANPAGGGADAGSAGQENGGKPSPAKDGVSVLTGKSNKVGGKLKGGNQHAFKA